MAGSRREKIGSIFSRMSGLMKSGAISFEERPLWYDIVKSLPTRPVPPQKKVQNIFYPEDFVRVHFYQKFVQDDPFMLNNNKMKSIPQRFIDKYIELHKSNTVPPTELFNQAISALKAEGIHLKSHEEKAAAAALKSSIMSSQVQSKVTQLNASSNEVDAKVTQQNKSSNQVGSKLNLKALFDD